MPVVTPARTDLCCCHADLARDHGNGGGMMVMLLLTTVVVVMMIMMTMLTLT